MIVPPLPDTPPQTQTQQTRTPVVIRLLPEGTGRVIPNAMNVEVSQDRGHERTEADSNQMMEVELHEDAQISQQLQNEVEPNYFSGDTVNQVNLPHRALSPLVSLEHPDREHPPRFIFPVESLQPPDDDNDDIDQPPVELTETIRQLGAIKKPPQLR